MNSRVDHEPMIVEVTCKFPSAFLAARRNGGTCNTTLVADNFEAAEQALYEHHLRCHNIGTP